MDFNQIVLSRAEIKALKNLQKWNVLFENDKKAAAALNRLVKLEFAQKFKAVHEGKISYIIRGTNRGADYLMYQRKERAAWIRYIITTVIAVIAIIIAGISLAAELGLLQLPKS